MVTVDDYRKYIKSSHIQDLIQLMVDIKKKEDSEQEVVPPKLMQAIAIRNFILMQISFVECLRSSNCTSLTFFMKTLLFWSAIERYHYFNIVLFYYIISLFQAFKLYI